MSWNGIHTWTVGERLTAANMNLYVSDNTLDLDRRTTPYSHTVDVGESTSSTTYTDLATFGPSVAVNIGSTGKALVSIYCSLAMTSGNYALASYNVTGATAIAANDLASLQHGSSIAMRAGATLLQTGLNAGSNTFTMKYRKDAGAGTADFTGRRIVVTPLGS